MKMKTDYEKFCDELTAKGEKITHEQVYSVIYGPGFSNGRYKKVCYTDNGLIAFKEFSY